LLIYYSRMISYYLVMYFEGNSRATLRAIICSNDNRMLNPMSTFSANRF